MCVCIPIEGGRKGGREEGGRQGGRQAVREAGRQAGRQAGREGGRAKPSNQLVIIIIIHFISDVNTSLEARKTHHAIREQ